MPFVRGHITGAEVKRRAAQSVDPHGKYVDKFIRRLGLSTGSPAHLAANVEATLDGVERSSVLEALARMADSESPDPQGYDMLWQSRRTARVTWSLFHRLNRALLLELAALDVGTAIADVGSGIGVTSAFLAFQHPERSVTAVEPVDAACGVLREFGRELGLDNLEVVHGGIEEARANVNGRTFDTVVCTLVLGEVTDLNRMQSSDPWSILNSTRDAIDEPSVPAPVQALASLLKSDGRYLGLERAVGAVETGRWLGWLDRAGLAPGRISLLRGDDETVPFVEAFAGGGHQADLFEMALERGGDDLAVEISLQQDPPVERLIGFELSIEDPHGSAGTRLEAHVLKSGEPVVVMSTTRGYRGVDRHRSTDEAVRAVRSWVTSARSDLSVASVVEL